MKQNKLTDKKMGELIGVHPHSVYRYRKQGVRPEDDIKERIYKVTHGDVTPNDFFNFS